MYDADYDIDRTFRAIYGHVLAEYIRREEYTFTAMLDTIKIFIRPTRDGLTRRMGYNQHYQPHQFIYHYDTITMEMIITKDMVFDDDSFGLTSLAAVANNFLYYMSIFFPEWKPLDVNRYLTYVMDEYVNRGEYTMHGAFIVCENWLNFGRSDFTKSGGESNPGPNVFSKSIKRRVQYGLVVIARDILAVTSRFKHWLAGSVVLLLALKLAVKFKSMRLILAMLLRLIKSRLQWLRFQCGNAMYSNIISWCSGRIGVDFRTTFKDVRVKQTTKHVNPKAHSHLEAAQERCIGNTIISVAAAMMGKDLYSYSSSATDNRVMDSERSYWHAKDLQMQLRRDNITKNHVIKLTDVDYYIDMNQVLTGNDYLLYTFVPTSVAGATSDGVYCVTENSEIKTTVHGGATYKHRLWDYDTDHIVIDHWWGSCFYLIEQLSVEDDRRVVFLNHIRTIYGPAGWFLPGQRLLQKKLTHGPIAHMKVLKSKDVYDKKDKSVVISTTQEMTHSFAMIGDNTSFNISDSCLTTCYERLATAKSPAISDIERVLRNQSLDDAPFGATVIYRALTCENADELISELRSKEEVTNPVTQFGKNGAYQTLGPLVTEDAKSVMRILHPPIFSGVIQHPGGSENNDQSCISGRVYAPRNQTEAYPPFYWHCIFEFLNHVVPVKHRHTLVPNTYAEQEQTLKRPTQRGFLNSIMHALFDDDGFVIRAFQKAEAYAKVANPRNICTLPTSHNFRLGSFIYPFCELLKTTSQDDEGRSWYAFGQHPKELNKTVQSKCQNAKMLVEADIDRNDGSMPYLWRCLDVMLLTAAYDFTYHKEILRLKAKEAYARGFTKNNVPIVFVDNTLSGSNWTSFRNTTSNACAHYIALRHSMTEDNAWNALGIYGGDDSLTPDIDMKIITSVFTSLGMSARMQANPPCRPVTFLGRYFLDLTTTSVSVIDPIRHFIKLHITHQPSIVPNSVVLHDKAEAYLLTDPNMPIIGDWARMVLRVIPPATDRERERCKKWLGQDSYYWAKFDDPFDTDVPQDLVRDLVCEKSELSPSDLDSIVDSINKIMTYEQLLAYETPIFREPKVEVPVAMNGIIHEPIPGTVIPHHQKVLANEANIVQPPPLTAKQLANAKRTMHKASQQAGHAPRPRPHTDQLCKYIVSGTTCKNNECRFAHDLIQPLPSTQRPQTSKPVVARHVPLIHDNAPNKEIHPHARKVKQSKKNASASTKVHAPRVTK